ncbi:transcription-repair coupling factor [Pseudogracilibacillus auburnensis]|uniref:Transcription-repair-coupling factor n=1 Tax=Pseudogracilibacillus auburnensis TaxID=1494959 RepID=A0A2V3VI94_9BACI|nr:transcription-repair coupling factor [Pseudogracilibacillus auburnensis]MBO1004453.1 transcription-repair coupling factor [Pseudogracilibacillus auburnensis]PXW81552.1 transcription-repair coupling factor [Pseudogracilibacillus auburnensis]
MKGIYHFLKEKEDIQSVIDGISTGLNEQLVAGLSGTARSLFISTIDQAQQKKTLIVTHQLIHAQQLYDDLIEFSNNPSIYLYPVNELIASEMAVASPGMRGVRINSLTKWLSGNSGILIAPIAALKRILPPPNYWKMHQLPLIDGESIHIESYITSLIDMGYERVEMVTAPSEFSVRGGIIDIYPVTEKHPVRVELFDDEIDSIRYFDADTQRSLEKVTEIVIGPAKELLLKKEDMIRGAEKLEQSLGLTLKKMKSSDEKEKLMNRIEHDIERLRRAEPFQEMYKYSEFFYENPSSLLDYLPKNGLIIFDEMSRIQESAQTLDIEEAELYKTLLHQQEIVPNSTFSFDWITLREKMAIQKLYMSVFLRHIPNTQPENIVNLASRTMQEFHGQMPLFKNELGRWEKTGFSVIILAVNENRAEKVQSILHDYGMEIPIKDSIQLPLNNPIITVGNISGGMELPMHKLAIVTENELFKKKQARVRKSQNISNAERIKNYQELKIGDYVVHRNHGIGKYIGIETLQVNKLHKDYLLIQYSGDDKLYVPIDQIDLVQKYVGSEGKEPRLYKLGGTEWAKVKRKVQSSVEDIADELIKLYAERQAQKGYAFEKDTELQQEFEHAFAYQETEDQLKSVEEIKHDMEASRPMDRLLCGDVGYGKTEVAIRAIFKAVIEGKQAAILVPTTILAQQHYQTMQERFQDYPINIGLLSRFRTRKQQNETIAGLKNGTVDVVIGTHRLLTNDVVYKDLGLLVVDEEQRFGVKHKEKIKQIKTNVDVLTLTATPIPRTLHMSMLGIRDLSVIETPPENRFPVQTYVIEHNPAFIREAIEREIARGGQVFLLYNRIDNIEKVAQEIDQLVEAARVTFAHGRMNETELENVMFRFLEGESDVLVSTTIIETGVDIPNVNTLIVYDADRMGLSQLYQLRGRVGRSNRIAYAYFTYRKDKVLTEVAEKRLQAIKEFTELGSGFKIAMRDLSIRGAGNLLGAQQHGFIDSVGFDLYSQMLKEAIDSRKTGKPMEAVQPFNPELTLLVDAYIPETYIEDEKQKIDMYKRFQSFQSTKEMDDLKEELIDRFGDYPKEVEELFLASYLKMVAKVERVEAITEKGNRTEMIVEDSRSQQVDGSKLFKLANDFGRNVQLGTVGNKLKVIFKWRNESNTERYTYVGKFIEKLKNVDHEDVVKTSAQ